MRGKIYIYKNVCVFYVSSLVGGGGMVENMEKGLFKLDLMLSAMFYSIFVMRLMNKASFYSLSNANFATTSAHCLVLRGFQRRVTDNGL